MTPEPTPVAGMIPVDVSTSLFVVMRTTPGLAADATSMVAEDSSIVTGWLFAATVEPVGEVAGRTVRLSAPLAVSAATVPPEARTAARSAAPTIVPVPPRLVAGLTAAVATGAVAAAEAGSYQRSGVGATGGVSVWRDQSGRASGGGEYRSTS